MKIYFSALCFLLFLNEVYSQLQPTRVCGIQIVIDKFLWRKFLSDVDTLEGELEVEEKKRIARYNLVSLTGRVVARANNVLSNQFLGRIKYKLILQNIQILDENCGGLCDPDLDLETLLNTFSYSSRDGYCLSYLLTYRTFENGKLGLAYTATTFHGGVCETFREQKEDLFGFERSINKSLNTGIVSFQRNGRQVSEQVGALTFAHEIGHSFGAVHDPEECAGNEEDGTYLMYKSGSLGLKKNNMEFSSCSVSAMAGVLSSLELRKPLNW
ncbi:disintegrin and metalloproteinase domain-containing protein 10 homolog isoform X2 [Eurytemora carolleeae]|uniref:disintegrin and metalloproteinase domain-containing protein 10 homolog isoform X2 n=1 Tax=Eurytemora carolleeae TaxID=1294199 RepID=UPI000C75BDEB|nr:disintegrin and metalloproteinase domain-containing protein 10 homolog isoform X2 [Eurytemora carolleeae]|eukprot:XP_023339587.1 disintegrin and metalloproteinase domain-containing protein 10 homolog isoform X2 [Eurytemora affinis]